MTFGGNPVLKPQKATQTTVGFVWEPVNGSSLGVDWFYLDLKNLVTNGFPIATILDPTLTGTYSYLVTRAATCAPSTFVPGAPCPITAIDQRFVNLGEVKIQGLDVDARSRSPAHRVGPLRGQINGTYYIQYDVTASRTAASRASCRTLPGRATRASRRAGSTTRR